MIQVQLAWWQKKLSEEKNFLFGIHVHGGCGRKKQHIKP